MSSRKLLAGACVGLVSLVCWQSTQGARSRDEMMDLYGTFVDAVEQVQANYVRPVDRKTLLEAALRGMLTELDPHSTYFNDTDWQSFQKQIEGSFTGIGVRIDLDRRSKRPVVVAPLVNSPAYAAGILAGDQILDVNGESTENWNSDKVVEKLSGRPGTDVTLTVLHAGSQKTETFTVTRKIIELDSVMGDRRKPDDTWDFLIDKDQKVGYVRIANFIGDTPADLKKALEELKGQGMKGLILDLRDDPGGLLSAAVEVSDLFIGDGKIVTTRGRNTREKVYEGEQAGSFDDFPMVVLINNHSASASEIVAACLQDYKRAKIVGQRSFGKGSVQNILPLDNGDSRLKLTVATYWRPSGKNIHRFKDAKTSDEWGVSPDDGLEVKFSDDQYVLWYQARAERDLLSKANKPADEKAAADPVAKDPQLAKALEVIRADVAAGVKPAAADPAAAADKAKIEAPAAKDADKPKAADDDNDDDDPTAGR